MGISTLKIRRSWDHLIINMGIPKLTATLYWNSLQKWIVQCGAIITWLIFSSSLTRRPIAHPWGRGMGCIFVSSKPVFFCYPYHSIKFTLSILYYNGLMQDCSISIANAQEVLQSWTKSSLDQDYGTRLVTIKWWKSDKPTSWRTFKKEKKKKKDN